MSEGRECGPQPKGMIMGFFSSEHRASDQQPKPIPAKRAARVARRGGNAIVATTSAPRPTRTERVRGGGRGA